MLSRFRLLLRTWIFLRARLEREMQEEMDTHSSCSRERAAEVAGGLNSGGCALGGQRAASSATSTWIQEEGRDARGARWIESPIADFNSGCATSAERPWRPSG